MKYATESTKDNNRSEYLEVTMEWYQVERTEKSVKQVVVEIPSGQEKDSIFGMLLFGAKFRHLMKSTWITGFFRLDGDPGPYLLVRGDDAARKLRGSPLLVAFTFYKMRSGGLMAIFVEADSPTVRGQIKAPHVLFEMIYGLDQDEIKSLFRDAFSRETLHLCFAEGDGPGESSGGIYSSGSINAQHDVVVSLPADCRAALKKEWDSLLTYHTSIPAGRRSFEDSARQMEAENPAAENPVLPRSARSATDAPGPNSISSKNATIVSQPSSKPSKKWWEFWK
jgi:hypothetical protein